MLDSEDIIRAVKKHNAIWNLEHEDYHNKSLKEDAWSEVCLDIYTDWETLSEHEKCFNLMELKKKWNNIRDYYKKLLAEQRPGEQVRAKKRRYLYSEILEFMRPVYEKKRPETLNAATSSNDYSYISSHFDHDFGDSYEEHKDEKEAVTLIDITTRSRRSPKNIVTTSSRPQQSWISRSSPRIMKKSTPLTPFERSIIKTLENQASKENDSDLSFFKSLLPDMKKMTDTQKFDFKLGVMELCKNICSTDNQSDVDHDNDHDYDIDLSDVKVETIRLTMDEDSYQ